MIISLCIHGPLYYSKVLDYSIYDVGTLPISSFYWLFHTSETIRVIIWIIWSSGVRVDGITVFHAFSGGNNRDTTVLLVQAQH